MLLLLSSWVKQVQNLLNRSELFVLLFVVLNLCITIPLAATLNIWIDEAYSLHTTSHDLGYAISQAIHFEEQAPLYFILLWLWRNVGESVFFARLFSVLCIALTVLVGARLSVKVLGEQVHPAWIAGAMAINPFLVWAAVEIRLYALSILLSSLLLLFFYEGYCKPTCSLINRRLYIFLAIVSLYTHYFLGFLIAAQGIIFFALNFRQKSTLIHLYLRDLAILLLAFLPLSIVVVQQFSYLSTSTFGRVDQISISWVDSIKQSMGGALLYLLPAEMGKPSPAQWRAMRVLIVSSALFVAGRYRYRIQFSHWLFWGILLVLCIGFLITFEFSDSIHFRHSCVMAVPVLFALISTYTLAQNSTRRIIFTLWLIMTLILNTFSLVSAYAPLTKVGDYARVAKYLETHEIRSQPVLVFSPEIKLALSYYYDGVNQLIALPKPEDFQSYDTGDFMLTREQEIRQALKFTSFPPQTLWLVTDTSHITRNDTYHQSYKILEAFINKYYSIKINQEFNGSNIKQLEQNRWTDR